MVLHFDLKSGYWQVDLHHKEKIAFGMGQQMYQFTVMTFGPCNAPAIFQALVETVLKGFTSHVSYLNDVILIGRTFHMHLLNPWKVFQRFEKPA
jgi:hypothetical protein